VIVELSAAAGTRAQRINGSDRWVSRLHLPVHSSRHEKWQERRQTIPKVPTGASQRIPLNVSLKLSVPVPFVCCLGPVLARVTE
jgi:hypothetical protein